MARRRSVSKGSFVGYDASGNEMYRVRPKKGGKDAPKKKHINPLLKYTSEIRLW